LFGSKQNQRNKTEIVLLITPYVVRNIERPDATTLEFASGTDSTIGGGPLGLRSADTAPAAASPVPAAAAPPAVPALPVRPQDEPVPLPSEGR
jgi:general secretion pathway protein D